MKRSKLYLSAFAINRCIVLFLLFPISVWSQESPRVLKTDTKVAFVDYAYLQNEYQALRNKLSMQKTEWQNLRNFMKSEKAKIDTTKNALKKERRFVDFQVQYKKMFDQLKMQQEQELKNLQMKIQEAVKAVANRGGYTEVRNTNSRLSGDINNITEQVLKSLNQ